MLEKLYEKVVIELGEKNIFIESSDGELNIFGHDLTFDELDFSSDMFFEYFFLRYRVKERDLKKCIEKECFFHMDYHHDNYSNVH